MIGLIMVTSALVAQNLFARTYGGTGNECAYSLIVTADGGYAVAGGTTSYGAGLDDFLVIKLSSTGNLEWARSFGGTNMDVGYSIIQTTDGGYAVGGETRSFVAGRDVNIDFLVLKLSSTGNLEWARTFGGPNEDFLRSIIQTSDGGFATVGSTRSYGAGLDDFLVIKLSSTGNLEWARSFGGTSYDDAFSVIQTTDGGYVVTGSTVNFGAGGWDFLILKLSSTGNLEWARTFGGPNGDFSSLPAIQTADNGFMFAGQTENFGAGGWDFLLIKLSSAGTLEWAKTLGGAGDESVRSISLTADGGFAVAGWTLSFGAGSYDLLMAKLSSAGTLEWARTFGGTDWDDAFSMVRAQDGGYTIAGWTQSFGASGQDILIIRLDTVGNYPDCVELCSPTTTSVSLSAHSPAGGAICSPSTASPNPTSGTPGLTIADVCPSQGISEEKRAGSAPGITCSPVPGGVLFMSPEAMAIKIYSADGRVAYSGNLERGENLIGLDQGVYLWQAGAYRGKAAVR